MIALLVVQSCAQTFIHNAIMLTDTSDNASYNQVHWLISTLYFSIKASNEIDGGHSMKSTVNNYLGQYMCHGSIFTPGSDMPGETTTRGEPLRTTSRCIETKFTLQLVQSHWENNL